jgi:hypothetical protein
MASMIPVRLKMRIQTLVKNRPKSQCPDDIKYDDVKNLQETSVLQYYFGGDKKGTVN